MIRSLCIRLEFDRIEVAVSLPFCDILDNLIDPNKSWDLATFYGSGIGVDERLATF